jgi:hypothetical protein
MIKKPLILSKAIKFLLSSNILALVSVAIRILIVFIRITNVGADNKSKNVHKKYKLN